MPQIRKDLAPANQKAELGIEARRSGSHSPFFYPQKASSLLHALSLLPELKSETGRGQDHVMLQGRLKGGHSHAPR